MKWKRVNIQKRNPAENQFRNLVTPYNNKVYTLLVHVDRAQNRGPSGRRFPTRVALQSSSGILPTVKHSSCFHVSCVVMSFFWCIHVFFSFVCIRFSLLVWVTYSLLVFGEQKIVQRLQQDQNRTFCVPLSHNSTDILAARVPDCE